MDREIKFRAWDKHKLKFIPEDVFAVQFSTFNSLGVMVKDWEDYREGEYFYDNAQAVMQYTGLKDDENNDIYEGDILQRIGTRDIFQGTADDVPEANPFTVTEEVVELKVKSDQFGTTSFGYSLSRQRTYSERTNPASYKVIGNIYENPELINQTKH